MPPPKTKFKTNLPEFQRPYTPPQRRPRDREITHTLSHPILDLQNLPSTRRHPDPLTEGSCRLATAALDPHSLSTTTPPPTKMSSTSSLPPSVIISSTRTSQKSAHEFLSTFLTRAGTDASLRPDSTLSEQGPLANSTSGTQNLTLYHLDRIRQGMEGKHLGVGSLDAGLEELGGEKSSFFGEKRRDSKYPKGDVPVALVPPSIAVDGDVGLAPAIETDEGTDWQNRSEFEQEQLILEGEVGDREGNNVAAAIEDVMPEEIVEGETGKVADVDMVEGIQVQQTRDGEEKIEKRVKAKTGKSDREKADRKAAKKARRTDEKRAKHG